MTKFVDSQTKKEYTLDASDIKIVIMRVGDFSPHVYYLKNASPHATSMLLAANLDYPATMAAAAREIGVLHIAPPLMSGMVEGSQEMDAAYNAMGGCRSVTLVVLEPLKLRVTDQ